MPATTPAPYTSGWQGGSSYTQQQPPPTQQHHSLYSVGVSSPPQPKSSTGYASSDATATRQPPPSSPPPSGSPSAQPHQQMDGKQFFQVARWALSPPLVVRLLTLFPLTYPDERSCRMPYTLCRKFPSPPHLAFLPLPPLRSKLSYEQFSQFLHNIKELNAGRQNRDETLRRVRDIFGYQHQDLFGEWSLCSPRRGGPPAQNYTVYNSNPFCLASVESLKAGATASSLYLPPNLPNSNFKICMQVYLSSC